MGIGFFESFAFFRFQVVPTDCEELIGELIADQVVDSVEIGFQRVFYVIWSQFEFDF